MSEGRSNGIEELNQKGEKFYEVLNRYVKFESSARNIPISSCVCAYLKLVKEAYQQIIDHHSLDKNVPSPLDNLQKNFDMIMKSLNSYYDKKFAAET